MTARFSGSTRRTPTGHEDRCPKGHELTPDNIRLRTNSRRYRECLTCYRAECAERQRRRRTGDNTSVDRARNARLRATRRGLRTIKRGDTLTLLDSSGVVIHTGSIDDVEQWLAASPALPPGPAAAPPPTRWRRWVELFVAEQRAAKRSPTTIGTRVGHLTAFASAHTGSDPLTVDRDTLVHYLGDNDWAPQTVHNVRTSLRVFFRLLYDLEHRRDDPTRTLPPVRLPRALPRPCPDEVVRQALQAVTEPRVKLAIRIGAETGLRRAEITRLQVADVDGPAGEYVLHIAGKGGHVRRVPISDALAAELLAIQTKHVFPAPNGGPITPEHLGKLVTRALPGEWTTHTLRHRFATAAYQATGDLRAVQELLGHTSPVTTATYTAVANDAMRRAAAAAAV